MGSETSVVTSKSKSVASLLLKLSRFARLRFQSNYGLLRTQPLQFGNSATDCSTSCRGLNWKPYYIRIHFKVFLNFKIETPMFPIGSSKTDWIWTVGSIPIVNQILTILKRVENPWAYCIRVLPEAWSPILEDAIYGVGDVTLNKGYPMGRRIHKR